MKKNEYEYKEYRITEGHKGWYVFPHKRRADYFPCNLSDKRGSRRMGE